MATARLEDFDSIAQLVEMILGTDRGRWWADPSFGSDLWLIRARGKIDETTDLDVFRRVAEEALAWLISDGIADRIEVTPQRSASVIRYTVTVFSPNGSKAEIKGEFDVLH